MWTVRRWGRKQIFPLTTLNTNQPSAVGSGFPEVPEEQTAVLDIMSSSSKQCLVHKWGCNFNSVISAGPGPAWSASNSLVWFWVPSWTNTQPNLRAAAARRGKHWRFCLPQPWLGLVRPGLAWPSPTGHLFKEPHFITGQSRPRPEGLAPAPCLCNHWEFPHVANRIFSFFLSFFF